MLILSSPGADTTDSVGEFYQLAASILSGRWGHMVPAALLFDLENTFFDGTIWHRQLHQMVSRWCVPIAFGEFKTIWQTQWLPRVYADKLEYWEAMRAFLSGLKVEGCIQAELLAAAKARLRSAQAGLRPYPGVASALSELQRAGCKLGILSNSIFQPSEVEGLLRRIGIQVGWDYCLTSRAAGHALPTAFALQLAARALGTASEGLTYVSRDPQRITLAAQCRLQTCLLAGAGREQIAAGQRSFYTLRELASSLTTRRAA